MCGLSKSSSAGLGYAEALRSPPLSPWSLVDDLPYRKIIRELVEVVGSPIWVTPMASKKRWLLAED